MLIFTQASSQIIITHRDGHGARDVAIQSTLTLQLLIDGMPLPLVEDALVEEDRETLAVVDEDCCDRLGRAV